MEYRQRKGYAGQRLAVEFLTLRGFEVVHQNLRLMLEGTSELGEIDIVARVRDSKRDRIQWWLIEVKTHASSFLRWSPAQKRRLRRSARAFSALALGRGPVAIALVWVGEGGRIEFLENP